MPPSQRNGQPRGASNSKMLIIASTSNSRGSVGLCQMAKGDAASQSRYHHIIANSPSARCSSHAPSSRSKLNSSIVSNNNGTTKKLTSGTASRLATGEITEVSWKNSNNNGVSPTATQRWICSQSHFRAGCRYWATYKIQTTAANDSQNPADNTAKGSTSSTRIKLRLSTCSGSTRRLIKILSITTQIITNALWVGMDNP